MKKEIAVDLRKEPFMTSDQIALVFRCENIRSGSVGYAKYIVSPNLADDDEWIRYLTENVRQAAENLP